MADTTYVDYIAPAVSAEWLNEVNDHIWHDTPATGTRVHDSLAASGENTDITSLSFPITTNSTLGTIYKSGTQYDSSATWLATQLVGGTSYKIVSAGTSNFTLVGAANNNAGTIFTATGSTTGTGIVINPTEDSFPVTYRFMHDYYPTTSNGALFNTDGANTFVGGYAGTFTMSPDYAAIGDYNIQCSYNAGFGQQACGSLTTGYNNSGFGVNALRNTTQGYSNVAVGRDSLELNTTGSYNVAVGQSALNTHTSGTANIAIGGKCGYDLLTGTYNTLVGYSESGQGITSGSNNTVIGSRISPLGNVSSNLVLATGDGTIYWHTAASGRTSLGASFTPVVTHHFRGTATTNGAARRTVLFDDATSFASGVGGGIGFRCKYNTAGDYSEPGAIKGIKENGTDGNFAGALVFVTQADGVAPAEGARLTSTKDFLLTAGTGALGYGAGAGGAVTQITSRTTAVTINKPTGTITLFTAAGSSTPASFTVNNSLVDVNDTILLSIQGGNTNVYLFTVNGVSAGSFGITFWSVSGTNSDTPILNYTLIKGSAS